MALSLKTISVGSETGVQDIQLNFTTIKSAVDALQVAAPTITKVSDYTHLNGTRHDDQDKPILILNYQTYQIVLINIWLTGINLDPWKNKAVLSIPKSYLRFTDSYNQHLISAEYFDNNEPITASLDASTGQVSVSTRNKAVTSTRMVGMFVLYN